MCPPDERDEMARKPVGERPQDVRSRTEVIKERDAKHLSDEVPGVTSDVRPADDAEDTSMRTGVERRHREGGIQAQTPDGKPYGHDWDADAQDDQAANTGIGRGMP